MEGVLATKILGRATLIDRKKLSRPIGPRERGLLFNEEKLRDSTEDCGIDENQNESYAGSRNGQRSSAPTRPEVLTFEDMKTFKKLK